MARDGTTKTGTSPDARVCPRCGKRVASYFFRGVRQWARHKTPGGRPCRVYHPPVPDAPEVAS